MEDNQIGARQPINRDQRSLTFQKLTPITLSDDEMRGYNEALDFVPRFYVSTSKSIIKALINMHSFEIQLSPIG